MSETADQPESRRFPTKPLSLRVLQAVLAAEVLGMIVVAVLLIFQQFMATPASRTSSLALTVLVLIGLALLAAVLIGALRRKPWIRGAAITWQILQAAAAWVTVQGDLAAWIGWVALAAALTGIACAVHPATRAALITERDPGRD